jgi:hypothetical protein
MEAESARPRSSPNISTTSLLCHLQWPWEISSLPKEEESSALRIRKQRKGRDFSFPLNTTLQLALLLLWLPHDF